MSAVSTSPSGGSSPRAQLDAFSKLLAEDGFSVEETVFASSAGNAVSNVDAAPIGMADFAAGLLLPRTGASTASGLGAGIEALKTLSANASGDEGALDRYRQAAVSGQEPVVEKAFAELRDLAGDPAISPLTLLGDLGKLMREKAGSSAAKSFAAECLAGRQGPLALALAMAANRGGEVSARPADALAQIARDVDAILAHGQPSDILFGAEGSQRALLVLGPVAQGAVEIDSAGGEVHENPAGFARDVKDAAVNVTGELLKSFKQSFGGILRALKGLVR